MGTVPDIGLDSGRQPRRTLVDGGDIDGFRTDSVRHRVHPDRVADRWTRKFEMTGLEIIGVIALTWWTIQIVVPGL